MSKSEDTRVLTKEEQERIFADWGNPEARKEFFNHNIRLVHHIVKKYSNTSFDYDDLFQTAAMGLWKAINTFDPQRGFQFATYASRVMNNEILMLLRRNNKCPLIDDIRVTSMQSVLSTDWDGNTLTLEEIISDGTEIDDELLGSELQAELEAFVSTYNPRNVEIVKLHIQGKTQKRIASMTGISQSYVSRIIGKFKKDLRKYLARRERI